MREFLSRGFRPAIALMGRLSFTAKLAAISLLFLLPFGTVFGLFLAELEQQIQFTQRERTGVEAMRRLLPVMQQLTLRRDLSWRTQGLSGNQLKSAIAEANASSKLVLKDWHILPAEVQELVQFSERASSLNKQIEELPPDLLEVTPQEWHRRHQSALEEATKVCSDLANLSNLILDPDLDAIYLTLAVFTRLPELHDDLGDLGECFEGNDGTTRPSRMLATQLSGLHARLKRAQERIDNDLKTAHQHSHVIDAQLLAEFDRHQQRWLELHQHLDRWVNQPSLVDTDDIRAMLQSASVSSESAFRLMSISCSALDQALVIRLERLRANQRLLLGGTAVCLLLIGYLIVGCWIALQQTVKHVSTTTQALLEGRAVDADWQSTAQDELSVLLRDFGRVATRLQKKRQQAEQESVRATRAEAESHRIQERLQLVLQSSTEGFWDWTIATSDLYYSPGVRDLLGYTEATAPPMHWDTFEDLLHPDDVAATMAAIQQHFLSHVVMVIEFRLQTQHRGYRWFRSRGQAVWDPEGRPIRMAGSLADVTERRQLEAEREQNLHDILESQARIETQAEHLQEQAAALTVARDAAEAGARAKSEFLANMSHELRTPLTAILGYSELLYDEGDLTQAPSPRLQMIESISTNGKHLLRLINDILDLSKIEAGKMTVERTPCALPLLLDELQKLMEGQARTRDVTLEIATEGLLPRVILSDSVRLQQILVNLVGNALKFTDRGSVHVTCRAITQSPPVLEIAVSDTGVGMSMDQLQLLFQPFTQADASTTRRFGGTGLGLSISQRLAHLLGGNIVAESLPGKGSTFTFRWMVEVPDDTVWCHFNRNPADQGKPVVNAPPAIQKVLEGARILVVDDVEANRKLVGHMLGKTGALLTYAANGQEAIDQALAQSFCLVLLDMQMPIKDGYTAARELRERGYSRPIIAMTAHAMAEDRTKCLAAGCDDFLTKPIDRRLLIQTCEHWYKLQSAAGKVGSPA